MNQKQLEIVYRPLSWFRPYDKNPRKNDGAVDRMIKSIKEFGFAVPCLCKSDGLVVDGHLRLKAAVKMPFEPVPVILCDGWTDAQVKAFRLMVNRSVNWAEFDIDLLKVEMSELKLMNFDLNLTGFDQREIDKMTLAENPAEDEVPPVPATPVTRAGDLWCLGPHRLLAGDSTNADDVKRLMNGERAGLIATDPPYGISYDNAELHEYGVSFAKIDGDHHEDEALQEFLEKAFRCALDAIKPNAAWYLWHAMLTQAFFAAAAAAAHVILHRQIIWVKPVLVFGRGQYHWRHELCQPPGTMVRMAVTGRHGAFEQARIEDLSTGQDVVSFSLYSSQITGFRAGRKIQVGTRNYCGTMYGVESQKRKTFGTDGHQWSAKLSEDAANMWCVYLMKRGTWWRIGKSKILADYGCAIKTRAKGEDADAAWVLSTHTSSSDVMCAEQIASVKYGIPTTHWRVGYSSPTLRDRNQIRRIYDSLDPDVMERGALRALTDHGRSPIYPFIERSTHRTKYSRNASMRVRSCNLLPRAMLIPVPQERGDTAIWSPVADVSRELYDGQVYSLGVEQLNHYIADGLITHNCFMGWIKGNEPPNLTGFKDTTVWEVGGVSNNDRKEFEHSTPKPVELFRRPILKHLKQGDIAYEPFAGSGPQFIAAELTERRCYGIEIEPAHCDTIVARWEKLTGKHAALDGDGRTFAEVSAERLAPAGAAA